MTTTVRPANAGAVTRLLKAGGMRHGESYSTRVKGWHSFTEGFLSTQATSGVVSLGYQTGDWNRHRSAEESVAARDRAFTKATEILSAKGYTVETSTDQFGRVTLTVTRLDASGKLVEF